MIIVMKAGATEKEVMEVMNRIEELGYNAHVISGVERKVIGAVGDERGKAQLHSLQAMAGVESTLPILKPYKLASRQVREEKTVVRAGKVEIGGNSVVVVAGPCSVENEKQIFETAIAIKEGGARILRGGAFKPRTSPYSFQGLGDDGLKLLRKVGDSLELPIQTEVLNPEEADLVADYADILQVGARNVQNFPLLKKLGKIGKPVFVKRGMSTTIEELLMSAEYILSEGNTQVILCERGIRTFETATRNTLDISAVPVLNQETHLPVMVDPSHATGNWRYVAPLCKAAVAAGADGLMVEVHPHPQEAFSDGPQSLKPDNFRLLMEELKPYIELEGRTL
jgi:3-deoxy-7-phosphoheptulonate synthase